MPYWLFRLLCSLLYLLKTLGPESLLISLYVQKPEVGNQCEYIYVIFKF